MKKSRSKVRTVLEGQLEEARRALNAVNQQRVALSGECATALAVVSALERALDSLPTRQAPVVKKTGKSGKGRGTQAMTTSSAPSSETGCGEDLEATTFQRKVSLDSQITPV